MSRPTAFLHSVLSPFLRSRLVQVREIWGPGRQETGEMMGTRKLPDQEATVCPGAGPQRPHL